MSCEISEPFGDNGSAHQEAVRDVDNVAGGRKVSNVALLVETSREFGRALLQGIARYSRLNGSWRFSWQPGSLDSPHPKWKNMHIHGAISRDIGNVRTNLPPNIPVVFVQHDLEDYRPYPAIITDSEGISKLAVEHFFDRGFKNLAFCGFDEHVWSRKRGEYFHKLSQEVGVEP